jgi:hypothetical protein
LILAKNTLSTLPLPPYRQSSLISNLIAEGLFIKLKEGKLCKARFPTPNLISHNFVDCLTYLGLDFVAEEGLLGDESLGYRLISLVERVND